MSELYKLIEESLGAEGISKLSQQLGEDENATRDAVGAALPALIGGAAQRSATEDGASGLLQLIDRDGDGNVLDDVQGFLGGGASENRDLVGQFMGGQQQRVEQGVSQASGLSAGSTQKLMGMLAPLVLGAMAKRTGGQQPSRGDLQGFLRKESESVNQQTGGLIGRLLDQDGDGDFDMSDIAKLAMGKLFGGR